MQNMPQQYPQNVPMTMPVAMPQQYPQNMLMNRPQNMQNFQNVQNMPQKKPLNWNNTQNMPNMQQQWDNTQSVPKPPPLLSKPPAKTQQVQQPVDSGGPNLSSSAPQRPASLSHLSADLGETIPVSTHEFHYILMAW